MNVSENISEKELKNLHRKFVQLGRERHRLKNELLALLPQIYEKGIYKKYCSSIVEYAGKYGDIAKSTVIKRLRLERNLEDKPCLKAAIQKVGIHKVAMVANLANAKTDEAFADKVINMSKSAVQTLAKELREKKKMIAEVDRKNTDGLFQKENTMGVIAQRSIAAPVSGPSLSLCKAVGERIKVELDEEMSFMFLKLKKEMGEHLSNKEVMRLILREMIDEKFASKKKIYNKKKSQKKGESATYPKSVTGESLTRKLKNGEVVDAVILKKSSGENLRVINGDDSKSSRKTTKIKKQNLNSKISHKKEPRPIRIHQKKIALAQTNGKCTYPGCNKPAENFHHRDRYSESHSHESITCLCKVHHEFMHNGLVINELQDVKKWQLDVESKPRHEADKLYRKYRQESLL